MKPWARECRSVSVEVEPIERPFSNFTYIDDHFPDIWPLRRIFSQVRAQGGKTMVVERLRPRDAKDLSEENEDIGQRFQSPVSSRVWRLSFFRKSFPTKADLHGVSDEDFIGYAIVKSDSVANEGTTSRIYESLIVPSPRENSFVRGAQDRICRVADRDLPTAGYLYAQQNGWTNACAHVACRTAAARFRADRDMTYREMNELPGVGIDHTTRTADRGLNCRQMVRILEAAGARCVVADYRRAHPGFTPPPYQKYVYGSIESGYPVIIFFRTEGGPYHAIPVFGHTFNQDMWVPTAAWSYFRVGAGTAYVPSEQWLSSFLAHDDNWGSNYCIPRHFLHTRRHCDKLPDGPKPCELQSECVAYVIATLPKNVEVNPIDAEVIGADYILRIRQEPEVLSTTWGKRLELYARQNLLVFRPILIRTSEYLEHLSAVADWSGGRIQPRLIELFRGYPEMPIWMVELSVPEVFSGNRRKLGELLMFADRPAGEERDFGNYLVTRVPGYFAFCTGGDANNPEFSFVPSGVEDHVSVFGCGDQ